MKIPTLHTERLTLRGPDARDIEPMRAFYASDRSRFVGGPLTAELAWRHLGTEIGTARPAQKRSPYIRIYRQGA